MAAAQDIARLSGVSLETASAAVAKAHEGNGAALAKLIPGLDKGANAQETLANATALAAGQADAYAASAPGQMAIVGDSFGELGEEVGSVFLPILKDLIGIVSSVTKVLQENSGAVKAVAVVVGVLAAGILAANVAIAAYNAIMAAVRIATVAWTVAQTALNLVLSLNPIGIVIIAITALIAAFVLAYQNSETFRNIVDGVFNAVVGFVQTAVATISRVIGTLTAILQAPFKAFEGMVRTVMDTVTGLVQAAVSTINSILDGIRGAIDTVANAVDSINPFAALPPPAAAPAVAGTARGTRRTALSRGARTGEAAAAGSLTVNVYGGDPWRIEQAVRRGYRGWTAGSGKGAPRREY
jgi:phage-related protein